MTDPLRSGLRDLSARLVALHAVLLDHQRRAYEATYGPTQGVDLLRLVLDHEEFAWLRLLSALIARVDEAGDADDAGTETNIEKFFRETYRLLRSGENGVFSDNYREALQQFPDAVIAHSDVMRILPRPSNDRSPS